MYHKAKVGIAMRNDSLKLGFESVKKKPLILIRE
jgi:hypothetical protein